MNAAEQIAKLLLPTCRARAVEGDIWSVLPEKSAYTYDRPGFAPLYDWLLGTGWYNRVFWRSRPEEYRAFAREAIGSRSGGEEWLLDAGGGSMLFTADAYVERSRPVVVVDQSLTMLRRAKKRMLSRQGVVPPNVVLLQGDLREEIFRQGMFSTIFSLNVLHHLEDSAGFFERMEQLLREGGSGLYCNSIVLTGRGIADGWLKSLRWTSGFARSREGEELVGAAKQWMSVSDVRRIGSMLYLVAGKQRVSAADAA